MKRSIFICVCFFFVSYSVTASRYFSPSYLVTTALALLSVTSRVNADVCECYGICASVSKFKFVLADVADEKAIASNERIHVCHLPLREKIKPVCKYVEKGKVRPKVKKNGYLKIAYVLSKFSSCKENKLECAGFDLDELSKTPHKAPTFRRIEYEFGASCREAKEKFYTSKSAEKKKGSAKKKRKMTKRRS